MEAREFAERVLLGTTLEEKLIRPDVITDERPGPPVHGPDVPGRPVELRFKSAPAPREGSFPGMQRLAEEQERGRLLHFFANHELLATELMALVLLRFPDAPAAFRRGICQTLQDEQRHLGQYLRRMRECGIRFGELPVSGYFWRALAPMESPMDYVAGLSLTFEQANLDFASQFARGFEAVGDAETAHLLRQIYQDEIGHVAYGLKWFRRWKDPAEDDWAAFCRQLRYPLSPSRAKGVALNREGRRAAGFDAAFIDQLSVHAQSKGRTPTVFLFNPLAEGRIAHGPPFAPRRHQLQLARDLENLPQFVCRQDDVVLMEERPAVAFLSAIKQAGFPLPEFLPRTAGLPGLRGRKLAGLRPWAWGPDSVERLASLLPHVTRAGAVRDPLFDEGIARLYSKAWHAEFLRDVLARSGDASWLCTEQEAGIVVHSLDAALAVIGDIRRRGHHRVVVKETMGLAGRNAARLWEPELLETHRRWIARALQRGRPLVIEPWLERELDFSVQLEMGAAGLKLCGYTGLMNDRRGQFQANWADPNHARRPPGPVTALLFPSGDRGDRLRRFYEDVFALLESDLRRARYRGPVGIDAFVYRAAAGECRLKPIVEINPRYTMGRVTIELMRRVSPGRSGIFRLVNRAQARAEGAVDFSAYARSLQERFPRRLAGEPVPRLDGGALCLNDPTRARVCLAVFHVGGERVIPESVLESSSLSRG